MSEVASCLTFKTCLKNREIQVLEDDKVLARIGDECWAGLYLILSRLLGIAGGASGNKAVESVGAA